MDFEARQLWNVRQAWTAGSNVKSENINDWIKDESQLSSWGSSSVTFVQETLYRRIVEK